jgi:hypothetical protein
MWIEVLYQAYIQGQFLDIVTFCVLIVSCLKDFDRIDLASSLLFVKVDIIMLPTNHYYEPAL